MTKGNDKTYDREREGVITALTGLTLNLVLGAIKLAFGIVTGSLSMLSDAVNNLSDVGTSAVVVSSFAISRKKADSGHPYGHGRYEYVAGFIVSIIIIFVGAELVSSSVRRFFTGEKSTYSLAALVVLVLSIAVKAFMAVMYAAKNKRVKSDTLTAACFDSVSDSVVTALVAAAFVAARFTDFPIDALCGVVAALFIVFGGFKIVVGNVNRLLGERPDGATEQEIAEIVSESPLVLGYHDLMVHDYGAEHKVASVDAEFDKNLSFVEVHAAVDEIERKAYSKYKINLVVHSDPVDVSDSRYLAVRRAVVAALEVYGRDASFHELVIDDKDKTVGIHLRLGEKLMRERDHITAEVMSAVDSVLTGYTVTAEYDFM